MTIKKQTNVAENSVSTAPGGAAIADRLRLDVPDPNAKKSSGGASTSAVVVGLLGLAVAGFLTYMLWQHWDFLMKY